MKISGEQILRVLKIICEMSISLFSSISPANFGLFPKQFQHSTPPTPLRVWVSLIRRFSTRFLSKLEKVVSKKFAQLSEPVFKIISALFVIWYNVTYAHKRNHDWASQKNTKKLSSNSFLQFLLIFFVRLQRSIRTIHWSPILE